MRVSDRLRSDMDEQAQGLRRAADGYRMTGERDIARKAAYAAQALDAALNALDIYQQAVRAAATQETQP